MALSGVEGKVKVGVSPDQIDMDVKKWNFKAEVAEVDTTTTAHAGWSNTDGWVKSGKGSFDFFYEEAKNPFATAQGLKPGSVFDAELIISANDKLSGKGLVTSVDITSMVKGAIEGVINFSTRGAWTYPS